MSFYLSLVFVFVCKAHIGTHVTAEGDHEVAARTFFGCCSYLTLQAGLRALGKDPSSYKGLELDPDRGWYSVTAAQLVHLASRSGAHTAQSCREQGCSSSAAPPRPPAQPSACMMGAPDMERSYAALLATARHPTADRRFNSNRTAGPAEATNRIVNPTARAFLS